MPLNDAEKNNSAGRLHQILVSAKKNGEKPVTSWLLWTYAFQHSSVPSNSDEQPTDEQVTAVIRGLMQFKQLIDEAESALKTVQDLPDRYLKPFSHIKQLPTNSLRYLMADVSGHLKQVSDADLLALEFCAERLAELKKEKVIDEKELHEISQEVTSLFEEVMQADLDPELKTFILDGLESIRRGISEFNIRGSERLRETLEEIIGSLAVNKDIIQSAGQNETLGKFENLFYRFAAVVDFAADATTLLAAARVYLLPAGG